MYLNTKFIKILSAEVSGVTVFTWTKFKHRPQKLFYSLVS